MKITKITYFSDEVKNIYLDKLNDNVVSKYLYPLGYIIGEYLPKDLNGIIVDEIIKEDYYIYVEDCYAIWINYDNIEKKTLVRYSSRLINNLIDNLECEYIYAEPMKIKDLLCNKFPLFLELYGILSKYKKLFLGSKNHSNV